MSQGQHGDALTLLLQAKASAEVLQSSQSCEALANNHVRTGLFPQRVLGRTFTPLGLQAWFLKLNFAHSHVTVEYDVLRR
eukprot:988962-Amphidinium_carterae.1